MRLKLATCQGSEIRCYGNAPTDARALVDSVALASIVPFPIKLSLLNVHHIRDVAGRNELRIVCFCLCRGPFLGRTIQSWVSAFV